MGLVMDRVDYNEYPDEYTPQKLAALSYVRDLLRDLLDKKQKEQDANPLYTGIFEGGDFVVNVSTAGPTFQGTKDFRVQWGNGPSTPNV